MKERWGRLWWLLIPIPVEGLLVYLALILGVAMNLQAAPAYVRFGCYWMLYIGVQYSSACIIRARLRRR